jgi:hypothetical protein
LLGGVAGFAIAKNIFGVLIGASFLCIIGYYFGKEKAFQLKLQAQVSLCQVAIEENTRHN